MDRVLSQTTYLRRSFPLSFIPPVPYPARSARHLPHAGKAVILKYRFPPSNLRPFGAPPSIGRRECPREPLPLEGAAEHSEAGSAFFFGRRSGAFVHRRLEMHFPTLFHTASTLSGSLRSPPSPRGEGCVHRYCFSTHACIRSDDMGIAVLSYRSLPHRGRGTASAVDRVLSQTTHLRRSPPLSFIPLVPYPARSARHLPHAGKALLRGNGVLVSSSIAHKNGRLLRAAVLMWCITG